MDSNDSRSRRSDHAWRHPLFWKMFAADLVLVGAAAIALPARTGERLIVLVAALAAGSLAINLVLTPPWRHAHARASRTTSLARRTLDAFESERATIADELRESCAQQLTALALHLTAAADASVDRTVAAQIAAARTLATDAARDITVLAETISPAWSGRFGLEPGLRTLHRRMQDRGTVFAELEVTGAPLELPLTVTRALLRVAAVALDNVERHAGAAEATITLQFTDGAVRLEVADDSRGFDLRLLDEEHAGLGLFRARELLAHAGGQMQIESAPGCGTRVMATFDLAGGLAHGQ